MIPCENQETLRLRPHHFFCDRFLPLDKLICGDAFTRNANKIKDLTKRRVIITVTEGPDQVCKSCPDHKNKRRTCADCSSFSYED
jgi:hypothetical protein